MEERLKNLKKAVDETAFKKLAFTSGHQQKYGNNFSQYH